MGPWKHSVLGDLLILKNIVILTKITAFSVVGFDIRKKLTPDSDIDGDCLILTSPTPTTEAKQPKLELIICVIKDNGSIANDDEDTEVSLMYIIMMFM